MQRYYQEPALLMRHLDASARFSAGMGGLPADDTYSPPLFTQIKREAAAFGAQLGVAGNVANILFKSSANTATGLAVASSAIAAFTAAVEVQEEQYEQRGRQLLNGDPRLAGEVARRLIDQTRFAWGFLKEPFGDQYPMAQLQGSSKAFLDATRDGLPPIGQFNDAWLSPKAIETCLEQAGNENPITAPLRKMHEAAVMAAEGAEHVDEAYSLGLEDKLNAYYAQWQRYGADLVAGAKSLDAEQITSQERADREEAWKAGCGLVVAIVGVGNAPLARKLDAIATNGLTISKLVGGLANGSITGAAGVVAYCNVVTAVFAIASAVMANEEENQAMAGLFNAIRALDEKLERILKELGEIRGGIEAIRNEIRDVHGLVRNGVAAIARLLGDQARITYVNARHEDFTKLVVQGDKLSDPNLNAKEFDDALSIFVGMLYEVGTAPRHTAWDIFDHASPPSPELIVRNLQPEIYNRPGAFDDDFGPDASNCFAGLLNSLQGHFVGIPPIEGNVRFADEFLRMGLSPAVWSLGVEKIVIAFHERRRRFKLGENTNGRFWASARGKTFLDLISVGRWLQSISKQAASEDHWNWLLSNHEKKVLDLMEHLKDVVRRGLIEKGYRALDRSWTPLNSPRGQCTAKAYLDIPISLFFGFGIDYEWRFRQFSALVDGEPAPKPSNIAMLGPQEWTSETYTSETFLSLFRLALSLGVIGEESESQMLQGLDAEQTVWMGGGLGQPTFRADEPVGVNTPAITPIKETLRYFFKTDRGSLLLATASTCESRLKIVSQAPFDSSFLEQLTEFDQIQVARTRFSTFLGEVTKNGPYWNNSTNIRTGRQISYQPTVVSGYKFIGVEDENGHIRGAGLAVAENDKPFVKPAYELMQPATVAWNAAFVDDNAYRCMRHKISLGQPVRPLDEPALLEAILEDAPLKRAEYRLDNGGRFVWSGWNWDLSVVLMNLSEKAIDGLLTVHYVAGDSNHRLFARDLRRKTAEKASALRKEIILAYVDKYGSELFTDYVVPVMRSWAACFVAASNRYGASTGLSLVAVQKMYSKRPKYFNQAELAQIADLWGVGILDLAFLETQQVFNEDDWLPWALTKRYCSNQPALQFDSDPTYFGGLQQDLAILGDGGVEKWAKDAMSIFSTLDTANRFPADSLLAPCGISCVERSLAGMFEFVAPYLQRRVAN
ncbi:hypothetical protein ACS5PN_16470 [Roseateles sp. NT4]|uniref:hypothetical protein n=1 Tax=Roseateles sp. NT4 TaxID=3453715 RepID=UPI003EEFB280